MKKSNLLKFILGLLILFILLMKLDIRQVAETFKILAPYVYTLAAIRLILTIFLNTLNLKILSIPSMKKVKYLDLLKRYFGVASMSAFSPGRIGDMYMIKVFKRYGIDYGFASAIVVIDKMISYMVVAILGVFGLFVVFSRAEALGFTFIIIVLFGVIILALLSERSRKVIRRIFGKYAILFKGFYKHFKMFMGKKRLLVFDALITLIRYTISAMLIFFAFLSFDIVIPIHVILMINCMGMLISAIPITMSGLGVRESYFAYAYSLIGIDPLIVGVIYLTLRIVDYSISGIVSIYYIGFQKEFIS